MGKKLVATYPILYESKQFKVGESLPANNHEMTKIWLDEGMVEWKDVDEIDENQLETEDKSNELKAQAIGSIDKVITEKEDNDSQIDKEKSENNKREPKLKKK